MAETILSRWPVLAVDLTILAMTTKGERKECPSCGRLMSDREAREQGACNDCAQRGGA